MTKRKNIYIYTYMSWQYEFDTLVQGNRMLQDTGIYLIHTLKPLSYEGHVASCTISRFK